MKYYNKNNGKKRKKGFINIFASFLLIFILGISLTLVREGLNYKVQIGSYERDLKFDYRLEAYYLILNLKFSREELNSMTLTPYGSLDEYKLIGEKEFLKENNLDKKSTLDFFKNLNYYIKLEKEESIDQDRYILKGYKKGKKRKEYIIYGNKNKGNLWYEEN